MSLLVEATKDFSIVLKALEEFSEFWSNSIFSNKENREKYTKKIIENGFFIVAVDDDKIEGYICGYANDELNKEAYISLLAINKNNGLKNGLIMKKLFSEMINQVKTNGMKYIYAELYDNNVYAKKIYDALGFKFVRRASDKSSIIKLDL